MEFFINIADFLVTAEGKCIILIIVIGEIYEFCE